jgi:hypothetical protein
LKKIVFPIVTPCSVVETDVSDKLTDLHHQGDDRGLLGKISDFHCGEYPYDGRSNQL